MNEKLQTTTQTRLGGRRLCGAMVVLFLGTFVLFFRTGGFDFVHFDDDLFVFENPRVNEGLTWEGIRWSFGKPDIDYWRPLSWLSHMLDVELFGLKAGGHHLVNVLWHALNSILLLIFMLRTTGRFGLAFFVAAMFAWHPLHVESVAWVSERKDVMCGFFWLASLCCYAEYARNKGGKWYAGSLGCFILGLASKPMIITLPFQLLLLDLWPLGRWRSGQGVSFSKLWREKIPFLLLTFVCGWGLIAAQDSVGALKSAEQYGLDYRLANAANAYAAYLLDTVWPTDLIFFYLHEERGTAVVFAGLVLLVVSAVAIRQIRSEPWIFSGWFWYLGTLVPVIGILQVGDQARGDRYTYIALVGVFWIVARLGDQLAQRGRVQQRIVIALAAVLVTGGYAAAWRQVAHWRNSETLFGRALEVDPDNIMALNNLAYLHFQRQQYEPSLELYQRLVTVDPENDRGQLNLADIYDRTGRPALAAQHWRKLVELIPGEAAARMSLVKSLLKAGDHAAARETAATAVIDFRNEPALLVEFADVLAAEQIDLASWCREIIARDAGLFVVHARLLEELRREDDEPGATQAVQQLLLHFPNIKEAHYHAALAHARFGRHRNAREQLERALSLDPGFAAARLELGRVLAVATEPGVHDITQARAIAKGAERALGRPLPQTLAIRAELAWREDEHDEALAFLSSAIQLARQLNRDDLVPELSRRRTELQGIR